MATVLERLRAVLQAPATSMFERTNNVLLLLEKLQHRTRLKALEYYLLYPHFGVTSSELLATKEVEIEIDQMIGASAITNQELFIAILTSRDPVSVVAQNIWGVMEGLPTREERHRALVWMTASAYLPILPDSTRHRLRSIVPGEYEEALRRLLQPFNEVLAARGFYEDSGWVANAILRAYEGIKNPRDAAVVISALFLQEPKRPQILYRSTLQMPLLKINMERYRQMLDRDTEFIERTVPAIQMLVYAQYSETPHECGIAADELIQAQNTRPRRFGAVQALVAVRREYEKNLHTYARKRAMLQVTPAALERLVRMPVEEIEARDN